MKKINRGHIKMAEQQKTEQKTEQKTALDIAMEKLAKAKAEVKELVTKYSLKTAKVRINKAYASIYDTDKTEAERLSAFWVAVEEIKADFESQKV